MPDDSNSADEFLLESIVAAARKAAREAIRRQRQAGEGASEPSEARGQASKAPRQAKRLPGAVGPHSGVQAALHPVPMVGYARVSTADQGDAGAGLEAQRAAIRTACTARRWHLVAIHEDVASGKTLDGRPGLGEALNAIHQGAAAGLVIAKLDRLSRSVIDAATTIEQAKREGWNLVALDLGVDFSTAAGEAMANMTAVFAQLERRLIGERTKAALAVRRAQRVQLGRPRLLPAAVRDRIIRERGAGAGWTAIAAGLNRDNVPTVQGGQRWYPGTVRKVIIGSAPDLLRCPERSRFAGV